MEMTAWLLVDDRWVIAKYDTASPQDAELFWPPPRGVLGLLKRPTPVDDHATRERVIASLSAADSEWTRVDEVNQT